MELLTKRIVPPIFLICVFLVIYGTLSAFGADVQTAITPILGYLPPTGDTFFNITVTNTDHILNITVVNISLPSGFIFIGASQWTSLNNATYSFSSTSDPTYLLWSNLSAVGIIDNGSTEYFYFNTSLPDSEGIHNFTITTTFTNSSTNVSLKLFEIFKPFSPGTTPYSPSSGPAINTSNVTDMFFHDQSYIQIAANFTGYMEQGVTGLNVTADFSEIGGPSLVTATDLGNGWYLLESNIDFSGTSVSTISDYNVTVTAQNETVSYVMNVTAVLINLGNISGCPPGGEPPEGWHSVPGFNQTSWSPVPETQASGCTQNITLCNMTDTYGPGTFNGSDWLVCSPTFGGDTTNLSTVAQTGDISSNPLVIEIPGKDKINSSEMTIISSTPATYTAFDSSISTDFNTVPDITNVSQPILAKLNVFRIQWFGNVNASWADLNSYITSGNNWVSVDSASLNSTFNSSANITIYNLPWIEIPVIFKDGSICSDCSLNSYSGGNCSFGVTHFSNYSTGANSNLSIFDQNDPEVGLPAYTNQNITFYANYTNVTSGEGIPNSSCNISFNVTPSGPDQMFWNSTDSTYRFNRTFSSEGIYSWNVTCNATGFEELETTDDITITIDTDPPNITVTNPLNTSYPSQTINLNVTTNEAAATCLYNLGAGNTTLSNDSQTNWFTEMNTGGEGLFQLSVYCNDTLGNLALNSSIWFTVDTTYPQFSNHSISPDPPNEDQDVTINATVTESSLDTVILQWNATTNYTVTTAAGSEYYFTINSSNYTAHDDLTYTWYANDTAGNLNASAQQQFTVTNQQPTQPSPSAPPR